MKIVRPEREVELCDICQRETGIFETCPTCARHFCFICRALIPGCIHTVDVCKLCGHREDVLKVVMKHAPIIKAAIEVRNAELETLLISLKEGVMANNGA